MTERMLATPDTERQCDKQSVLGPPRPSFSPLQHLGLEGCPLRCNLDSCFGVFYRLTGHFLYLTACRRQAACYGLYIEFACSNWCPCFLCSRPRSALLHTHDINQPSLRIMSVTL